MCYLLAAGLAEHYCNNVKAERSVLNVVCGKKITGGPEESVFFGGGEYRFGRGKGFIGSGLYLDKDYGAVGIDHNEVDFTGFAGEVSGEFSEALSFQEPLASFFAPPTKKFVIGP